MIIIYLYLGLAIITTFLAALVFHLQEGYMVKHIFLSFVWGLLCPITFIVVLGILLEHLSETDGFKKFWNYKIIEK